jgi:hypothetical protein
MPRPPAVRTAAAAAVLFAISFFLTVASVNVPHTSSDAKLLAWWQDGANVRSGLISLLFAVCTAVFFTVVVNYLLTLAGRTNQVHWTAFARSMSAAFSATLLVSAAIRGVIGHLVQVQDEPLPAVDVLRYSTALNYTLIGTIVMAMFALAVIALGVVVLRTDMLARWAGFVGLGCGTLILVAAVAMVGQFTIPIAIIWALSTAVAVWRQPVPTPIAHEAIVKTTVA